MLKSLGSKAKVHVGQRELFEDIKSLEILDVPL
jgi:hypothetical protein